jgi:hypothetical protein
MPITYDSNGLPRKLKGHMCKHKAPMHRTYTEAALGGEGLESLQTGYWAETLIDHTNNIISHIALESCGFNVGGQMLFAALVDIASHEDALAYAPGWYGKNPEEYACFSKFCVAQMYMIHSIMHRVVSSKCGDQNLVAVDRLFAACSTEIAIAAQKVLAEQYQDIQDGIEA